MADPVVPPPKAERQIWTGKERLSTNRNPAPPVVPLPEQHNERGVRMCAQCGHSSDQHAFSDSYVSDPDPSHEIDFGPTHCHALGHAPSDCENTFCKCSNFTEPSRVVDDGFAFEQVARKFGGSR